ncbi:MAG: tetratricopeptide repeat protein [Alphaproteobacteria bacterium]
MDAWLEQDFIRAMSELMPVAEAGDATAQELVGVLHALGLGVPQDRAKAFAWYLRAAQNGHAGAQSGVGWYYEVGLGGVPVDLVLAHTWYTVSAVGGDIDAAVSVTEVEKKMSSEQISAAQLAARRQLGR